MKAPVVVLPLPVLLARLTDAQPVVVVCAWCPGYDASQSSHVSHGICPACAAKLLADEGVTP